MTLTRFAPPASAHEPVFGTTQVVHSRLVEGLRPDNPLAQAPYLAAPFSLTTPGGIAAAAPG